MAITPDMTDAAVLAALGERLARRRLDQNRTQAALATEAGVSRSTVARLEAGESSQMTNLVRVLRALGLLGRLDAAVPEPVPSPLAQLRSAEPRRRRASSGTPGRPAGSPPAETRAPEATPWRWGDEPDEPELPDTPEADDAPGRTPGS